MRRFVTGPRDYLADLGRATARGWSTFFFTPADPTALGLIRVVVGALLFRSLWIIGLDLHAFLGIGGWADLEAVRGYWAERAPWGWSFWMVVPEPLLRPVWVACLVVLGLFTVGRFSRTTAVLAWVIAVSTVRRAPVIVYGFDQIVATWALYLAVSGASGQAVSLDRFLARWRTNRRALASRPKEGRWSPVSGVPEPTISANLGLRLIQLHLCLIYGMSGLAKLRGNAWWDGQAIWGVLAAAEFRRFDLTWMAAYPLLLNVLTHTGLAFELGYPVLIWVRRLRPLLIGMAILMHLGIALTLGLTEFAVAMLAGNLAFASGPWLRSLVAGRLKDEPAGRLLYDGACPRCRASMALVAAADPERVVEPIDVTAVDVRSVHPSLTPEACLKAMHLVRRDGRVLVGFDAVAALGRWLPLAWPLGIVALIPGIAPLGRRVYDSVAASRPRDGTCTDEVCAVGPASARSESSRPAPSASPTSGRPRR